MTIDPPGGILVSLLVRGAYLDRMGWLGEEEVWLYASLLFQIQH